jgi:AAA family ATP:ADP antiporter
VAFVILVLNYVNTTGEYIKSKVWQSTVKEATAAGKIEASEEATSQYYTKIEADFTSTVNLLTFLIQLFLVSRIFKWFGVRGALLFLPFISLGGYSSIALLGASFAAVRWTKILENSTDYSLMNTTRGALYLITSREEKYKSKAAIDTFFVRIGDVLHSLTVFVGTTYLALTIDKFAKINVFMAVIWIILCFCAIREHKKLSAKRTEYQLA